MVTGKREDLNLENNEDNPYLIFGIFLSIIDFSKIR